MPQWDTETDMSRLILRYRKPGPIPDVEKEQILGMESIALLDESSRMLLVEGSEDILKAALKASDWSITPEIEVELPSPRRRPTQT